MINIQPISELRNYNSILDEVKEGQPVYLTKNGKGVYAIVDIKDAPNSLQSTNYKYA